MKLSDLKEHLEALEEIHGDIEVVICDADTGWLFRIVDSDLIISENGGGSYLEIGPGYGSEIDSTEINKG